MPRGLQAHSTNIRAEGNNTHSHMQNANPRASIAVKTRLPEMNNSQGKSAMSGQVPCSVLQAKCCQDKKSYLKPNVELRVSEEAN